MGSLNLSSESVSHETSAQSSHLNIHVIPEDTEKISYMAFYGCTNLKEIDLSKCEKLETIEEEAFEGCTNLETVILPSSLKTIGKAAFVECIKLKEIDLSKCEKLETIGRAAFNKCTSLKEIDLSKCEKLETIEEFAFDALHGCTSRLETVILPSSLKTIGKAAFRGCTKLKEIDLSKCEKLETIGGAAFDKTGLIEIVIPDTVENIGENAFSCNENLERATIGCSAKNYSYFGWRCALFYDTPSLKELTFRSEVAEFSGAVHLTKVTFADTVKELGVGTVAKCEELEEIIIPDSITKIGNDAFAWTRLKEIVFPSSLQELGCLGTDLTKLKKLDFSKVTKLKVIPEGFIGDNTPKLKEIALPIGVTTIQENIGGENLKRLFLPPTIQEVENLHQFNIDIYCFSPAIEELEPIAEDIDEEEKAIRLYVLPAYLESYKAQREAERINEKFLIIDVIPEEYRYFYDK